MLYICFCCCLLLYWHKFWTNQSGYTAQLCLPVNADFKELTLGTKRVMCKITFRDRSCLETHSCLVKKFFILGEARRYVTVCTTAWTLCSTRWVTPSACLRFISILSSHLRPIFYCSFQTKMLHAFLIAAIRIICFVMFVNPEFITRITSCKEKLRSSSLCNFFPVSYLPSHLGPNILVQLK
jgi:hypothetical protein